MLFHEKIPQNTEIHLKNSATYIYLKLKGRNVKTLVDSGAESTLISKSLADQLKLAISLD